MSSGVHSAAVERQVKKIYDCLNIGCHKKAVQEIDRLPKNTRDLTVFKALKSLALIRMYKRRQAFEILNRINPENDLDEVTLQTMTSCYKESVDVERIVDLYEAAAKRKSDDPEVMSHLFMAYVRVFNFKRQKEIALQMYKTFTKKKRLYSFWAIMSLVMQSQENQSPDDPDKRVCLSLAEKMCEKMIDEERTNEEIELYLMILRKQNKHEEEYRFLTGPIFKRITDHLSWYNRRRAYLCLDLKMYSRAFKHYFPTLIQEYPDQIEYYQGLFRSAFLLDTEAPSQQHPVAINEQQSQAASGTPVKSISALAECYDIVEKQCTLALDSSEPIKEQRGKSPSMPKQALSRTSSSNRKRMIRGPFIARAELYHTILSNEHILPDNMFNLCKNQYAIKYPKLNSLIIDYFKAFSKKVICYYDMEYMISRYNLSKIDKDELVENIKDWINELRAGQQDLNSYDLFHIVMNHEMLKHSLSDYETSDSRSNRLTLAKKYIDLYDDSRHLGLTSSKTEFQPVDNYAVLAINSIMTNSVDYENITSQTILTDSILVSLIVLTENAISNSPSNHHLKLLLLKLYSFIGASKQSSEVLLSLDMKHFQIDTLGHLLNPVLYNTGNYTLSRESLETCFEFYAHGVRECFEGLTTSYRDGRFSKVEDISRLLKRLCDSLNATQCVLLKGIVANISACNIEELSMASQSFDSFKGLHRMFRCPNSTDTIKDSRDFKVLKSLHFETNESIQKRQVETMEDEQLWLKLRYYLLRSVHIQIECIGLRNKLEDQDNHLGNIEELAHSREAVEKLLSDIEKVCAKPIDRHYSFLEPEASPFRWTHVDYKKLLALTMPLVFIDDIQQFDSKLQEDYNTILGSIVSDLERQLTSIDSLVTMKQTLASLTFAIEFISLCTTSLVAFLCESNQSSKMGSKTVGTSAKPTLSSSLPSQQPQAPSSKHKSIPHQMINKTSVQLTKLTNLIKAVDPKVLILDKMTSLDSGLLSEPSQSRVDTKCGSVLLPIMGREAVDSTFARVKEKIMTSYTESLREIESTCKRKMKLLTLKT